MERLVGSHYSSAVPGFGPKSFPRGRRGSHRPCGGSIGRAVAIFSEPTSAFTLAPLVARSGGTPCWIPFSLAVPGFALRNRSRVVRDLCFSVVEGPLCARQLIISGSNVSGEGREFTSVPLHHLVGILHFFDI